LSTREAARKGRRREVEKKRFLSREKGVLLEKANGNGASGRRAGKPQTEIEGALRKGRELMRKQEGEADHQ